jgi:hypothetical protein
VGLYHVAVTLLLAAPARAEVSVGGSAGGFVPLSGLDPTVVVGVEASWARGALGLGVAADLAQPRGDGRAGEARYALRARELRLAVLLRARWPGELELRPFAAAGPALLLVETRETGVLGGERFGTVVERAVRPGLLVAAGVEAELGPGAIFAAAGLGVAAFDGTLTGDASAAALDLRVGYRFRL